MCMISSQLQVPTTDVGQETLTTTTSSKVALMERLRVQEMLIITPNIIQEWAVTGSLQYQKGTL